MDWEIIKKLGLLAAILPIFYALKGVYDYFLRSKLKIYFDENKNLKKWAYSDTKWVRSVFTLDIKNKRKHTAKRCVGILTIIEKPQKATNIQDSYTLHWADIPYNLKTTGAEPVSIGPETARLDVAFTQKGQEISGCWIAMQIALSGALVKNQAYLLPGEYKVKIEVKCENGKGDKKYFKIISPESWDGLNIIQRKYLLYDDKRKAVKEQSPKDEQISQKLIDIKDVRPFEEPKASDSTSCESASLSSVSMSGIQNDILQWKIEKEKLKNERHEKIMPYYKATKKLIQSIIIKGNLTEEVRNKFLSDTSGSKQYLEDKDRKSVV